MEKLYSFALKQFMFEAQ